MAVLVTGASGRIGSLAVDALLEASYRVRGLDRRQSGRQVDGYDEVVGHLHDKAVVAEAVDGVEIVLHLGAYMSWSPRDRSEMFSSNVEGTRTLLDAAARAGVGRLIFASSGEVYPESAPVALPIGEDHPLWPDSQYGLTKLIGEELVRFHQRTGTMETVILRFGHTQNASELVDEDSFFSGPRFFLRQRIRQQEEFGNVALAELLRAHDPGEPAHVLACSETGRPYMMHITDTRDIVSGLMLVIESREAAGDTFNLCSNAPVRFDSLLPQLARVTGYPVIPVNIPGPGVHYHTSNDLFRERLGFKPRWTIDLMLEEAASSWKARSAT